jgi:hypothetical protein
LSKATRAKAPVLTSSHGKKSELTHIIIVAPPTAKEVKLKLAGLGWLDKRYRMTKVSPQSIAIPITADGFQFLSEVTQPETPTESWYSLILDKGQQEMPFSTAQSAAKGKQ